MRHLTTGCAAPWHLQVIEDVERGWSPSNPAYHHAEVLGAGGRRIGSVRYSLTFRKPLDAALRQFKEIAASKAAARSPAATDAAAAAIARARASPASAACIRVHLQRCEGLVAPGAAGRAGCRPYASYRFPGHEESHDTQIMAGVEPIFNDFGDFLIARSPDLERYLKTATMPVYVFDDAAGADAAASVIGVASIDLANLATGATCGLCSARALTYAPRCSSHLLSRPMCSQAPVQRSHLTAF